MGFDNRGGSIYQPLPVPYRSEKMGPDHWHCFKESEIHTNSRLWLSMDSLLILQQWAEDIVVTATWWLPATQPSKSYCFCITYTTRILHSKWGESQVHTRFVAPWWNMTINVSSGLWPQRKGFLKFFCILTPWFPVNPISGLAVRPCKTNKIN